MDHKQPYGKLEAEMAVHSVDWTVKFAHYGLLSLMIASVWDDNVVAVYMTLVSFFLAYICQSLVAQGFMQIVAGVEAKRQWLAQIFQYLSLASALIAFAFIVFG